jgi:thiol-disulfide isomerase/thioredoxin
MEMKRKISLGLAIFLIILAACNSSSSDNNGLIEIILEPKSPGTDVRGLRWSPKGEKLFLESTDEGLTANLYLGMPEVAPVRIRLSKVDHSEYYNQLELDRDRDGQFQGQHDTVLVCQTKETRGKIWSSFQCELEVPFERNKYHKALNNPYPISFWYVEDPLEENPEGVIRYSRSGWMQGRAETPLGVINVLVTESMMDGFFDRQDSWAVAPDSVPEDLFSSGSSRSLDMHTWLGNQALGVDSILPSGRVIWLKAVDPKITRQEEEAQKDWLAPDRAQKRSGNKVNFLHDYEYAAALAKQRKQLLLVDFETTWCGPCKTRDQWVYTADTIIKATENIICVKVDGDENRDLVQKHNVTGYPTLIVLDPDGYEKSRGLGYQSVEKTLKLLNK